LTFLAGFCFLLRLGGKVKRFLVFCWSIVKWSVAAFFAVEALCFCVILASNYLIYGEAREGTRSVYDPYALYLQSEWVRVTGNNSYDPTPGMTKSVWFFGGSTMRASATSNFGTIPAIMAGRLNAEDKVHSYFIDNYGVNSFNSLMETKYLQKLLIERHDPPNLVVFYDGANDASYLSVYRAPYAHEGYDKIRGMIESYHQSTLGLLKPVVAAWYASYTRELVNKIRYLYDPLKADSDLVRDYVTLTVMRYDYINRLVGSFGSKFVLFLQPLYWTEQCPDLDPDVAALESKNLFDDTRFPTTRRNFLVVYAALKQALKDRPYFVDMQNILCDRKAECYTPDGVHNTDYAREMLAKAMQPYIERLLGVDR
jgi:hypothetical protein